MGDARARERLRVRRHLAGAERLARGRRAALDPIARCNRALLLDELARYRRRGVFPRNAEWRTRRVPQFVDEHGTHCAVGHLMAISGQGEVVRHIAATRNAARVGELARLPELRAWLSAAGLSVEEAARIQPTYSCHLNAERCVCELGPRAGAAVGSVLEVASNEVRVRIERLAGDLAGVSVGDERIARSSAVTNYVGEQVIVSLDEDAASDGGREVPLAILYSGSPGLQVAGDDTSCRLDLVSMPLVAKTDTILRALSSERDRCVELLVGEGQAWSERHCDEAGIDVVAEAEDGCQLGTAEPLGAAELTSTAVLAALLAYRRRRRRGA